jgi:hypothetical protein
MLGLLQIGGAWRCSIATFSLSFVGLPLLVKRQTSGVLHLEMPPSFSMVFLHHYADNPRKEE